MLISVELEEENSDLKSQLLAYDLIEETEEVLEDHPHYIQTSLKLMEKSQYSFPSYEFSPDIFYPVIIGDLAVENYLCLQLTWFTNVDSAEKEDINDLCNKFVQDEDRIKAEYRGFQKAVDFPVGKYYNIIIFLFLKILYSQIYLYFKVPRAVLFGMVNGLEELLVT